MIYVRARAQRATDTRKRAIIDRLTQRGFDSESTIPVVFDLPCAGGPRCVSSNLSSTRQGAFVPPGLSSRKEALMSRTPAAADAITKH